MILYLFVIPQLTRGGDSAEIITGANPVLLATALLLQLVSLVAYSALTKATLPSMPLVTMFTLVRIQLSTKALAHVLPGGAAAGGALGYRLLTLAGIAPAAAGFTITAAGLGSALVLNLILWVTLMISIPTKGLQPGYLAAALVGVVLLGAAGVLLWLLMAGRHWTERSLRAVARLVPFLHEDAAGRAVHQLGECLRRLAARPQLVRRGTMWAAANWLLDAASLWVVFEAFGYTLNPLDVLVAFSVGQVLGAIPITPGGLGLIETILPAVLVGLTGIPIGAAIVGVLGWRFLQFWMPIAIGAASYASLRRGVLRRARPVPVSHVAS